MARRLDITRRDQLPAALPRPPVDGARGNPSVSAAKVQGPTSWPIGALQSKMVCVMTNDQHVQLDVRLELGAEPICGTVNEGSNVAR
ncbi:MAG: hypothetical protein QOI64_1333 [Solirubrobacteraceae bacterium]|jgi:hypothetical protein|nr:hypothetical protein [Solirubrobacteraceae bacterium]